MEFPVFEISENKLILNHLIKRYTEDEVIFQIMGILNIGYLIEGVVFQVMIKDIQNNIIALQSNIPYQTISLTIDQINIDVSDLEINKRADYKFFFTLEILLVNHGKFSVPLMFIDNRRFIYRISQCLSCVR